MAGICQTLRNLLLSSSSSKGNIHEVIVRHHLNCQTSDVERGTDWADSVCAMSYKLARPAARCVLLDQQRRIFLIRSEDPIDPYKPEMLEIPGGGIDHGEDSDTACRRELYEETGISEVEMGPCVWTQYVEFTFCGIQFASNERIHVAWCEGGDFRPQGLEALEAAAFIEAGWWTLDALLANQEPTVPARLREFLPDLIEGDVPSTPIDISPH